MRRYFLKGLLVSPAILLPTAARAESSHLDSINTPLAGWRFERGDYRFLWTGWKTGRDNDFLAGQWLAHRKDGGEPSFYASCPGRVGPYHMWALFDLTPTEESGLLTLKDLSGDLEEARRKSECLVTRTRERLLERMVTAGVLNG